MVGRQAEIIHRAMMGPSGLGRVGRVRLFFSDESGWGGSSGVYPHLHKNSRGCVLREGAGGSSLEIVEAPEKQAHRKCALVPPRWHACEDGETPLKVGLAAALLSLGQQFLFQCGSADLVVENDNGSHWLLLCNGWIFCAATRPFVCCMVACRF